MKYPIVTSKQAGATLQAMLPTPLPLRSFRDFYAFEQHVKTARGRRGLEMVPQWYEFPVFYYGNPMTLVGHDQDIVVPDHGSWLDFELEIGCIIGRAGRDIEVAQADNHIAGYTIINDWSLRDVQRREMAVGLGPAKGKDFATSVGPQLVTPEELADKRQGKGYALTMTAHINGNQVSQGRWSDITYSFAEMIARASQGVTLHPGDVLGSGTVGSGCLLELGAAWLKAGDVVELQVEGLGQLRNRLVSS